MKTYKEIISERAGNKTFTRKAMNDLQDLMVQLRIIEKNQKNRKNDKEFSMAKDVIKKAEDLKVAINNLIKVI